jgi:ATP-dependent Lhr-like helicase
MPYNAGEHFSLAGFNWIVVGVDFKRLHIFVKPMPKKIFYLLPGDRAPAHDRVVQRMGQVLFEETEYPYLSKKAHMRLLKARESALSFGFDKKNVFDLGEGQVGILPWFGHRNYHTLRNIISHYIKENGASLMLGGWRPFYLTIKSETRDAENMLKTIKEVMAGGVNPDIIFTLEKIRSDKKQYEYKVPKYDRYVPNALLKKQVIKDYVDLGYLTGRINKWR